VVTQETTVTVAKSRTFRSGNSDAERPPCEVAFGAEIPVTIVRYGDVPTLNPTRPSIKEMVERLSALSKPGAIEGRDEAPLPERTGL
jgi:antitoxin VapB